MKISEILNEEWEKSEYPMHDMVAKMVSKKQPRLGGGSYAQVLAHPTQDTTVVKIFVNDRGYAEWLKWCLAHQNNKYVPKIIPHEDGSIIKLYKHYKRDRSQRIGIVHLEKLQPIDSPEVVGFSREIIEYLDKPALDKVRKKMLKFRVANYFELLKADDWHVMSLNAENDDPDLAEVCDYFSRVLYGDKLILDLNNDNMMRRVSANQIVFTDPLTRK